LFWTINEKQASNIGGRTARALLRKESSDEEPYSRKGRALSLRSLFLDFLRLETAGDRFREGSYRAELDRLVEVLDNMTERRVVPGRIFTPSTLYGKDDLLLSVVAILTAATPDDGDDGLGQRIAGLGRDERALPEGDRSLRHVVHELDRFHSTLEQPWPQVARGVALLAPDRDADRLAWRLRDIVASAKATIEAERLQRLKARPVDPVKLERIRSLIETALLNEPVQAPFFEDVKVGRAALGQETESRDMLFQGIAKAELTDPPMATPVSKRDEFLVSGAQEMAGSHAWNAFCQRPRTERQVGAPADDESFWQEIAPLVSRVGANPVLVVSKAAEARVLKRLIYAAPADRPNLTIERRRQVGKRGTYVATIEGVDVFALDLPPGNAWLFSGKALQSVLYAEIDQPSHYVAISFELGDDMKGTLRVRVRQLLEWSNAPSFALHMPDPTDHGSD
jgi:hypothetical protein